MLEEYAGRWNQICSQFLDALIDQSPWHHGEWIVFRRVAGAGVSSLKGIGIDRVSRAKPEIQHMAAIVLYDAERLDCNDLGRRHAKLLLEFGEKLPVQREGAIGGHCPLIDAAGGRELPHACLIDRSRVTPAEHHAVATTHHPAHGERPQPQFMIQLRLLHLRDDAPEFREMTAEVCRG